MKRILVFLVKVYRYFISPLLGSNNCRFNPTCSKYAIEAIEKKGIFRGIFLVIYRILRCNPLSKGGDDFVK